MPSKRANVKSEKEYLVVKHKVMSKVCAAKIKNSRSAESRQQRVRLLQFVEEQLDEEWDHGAEESGRTQERQDDDDEEVVVSRLALVDRGDNLSCDQRASPKRCSYTSRGPTDAQ
jgi:hypothetical protein